jgi:hypothetical protein
MKTLTLVLALFACLTLSAAKDEATALRNGVDDFLTKSRVVSANPFGGKSQTYTLLDKPTDDKTRRVLETVVIRDAAKLSAELSTLAKQSIPVDAALVGQIQRTRAALEALAADKSKIAEALRQLSALR